MHLLDANVLIDANRLYYSITRVPEFWEWLESAGAKGLAKIPIEIYEEIKRGDDELAKWAKDPDVQSALRLDEDVDVTLVRQATERGYGSDLTDDEIEKIGRDPFLVAYALSSPKDRCVVTTEVSKPSKQRANRHLPDVCRDLGVTSYNTFEFLENLDFRTNWHGGG